MRDFTTVKMKRMGPHSPKGSSMQGSTAICALTASWGLHVVHLQLICCHLQATMTCSWRLGMQCSRSSLQCQSRRGCSHAWAAALCLRRWMQHGMGKANREKGTRPVPISWIGAESAGSVQPAPPATQSCNVSPSTCLKQAAVLQEFFEGSMQPSHLPRPALLLYVIPCRDLPRQRNKCLK